MWLIILKLIAIIVKLVATLKIYNKRERIVTVANVYLIIFQFEYPKDFITIINFLYWLTYKSLIKVIVNIIIIISSAIAIVAMFKIITDNWFISAFCWLNNFVPSISKLLAP